MTEQTLFVSLGHNSSAAFAMEGRVMRAYEQERIDRLKSSSAYPREAIDLAVGSAGYADVAYVSHWFDDLTLQKNKYVDLDHLHGIAREVVGLTPSFTHHDAHATSACSFYRSNGGRLSDAIVIVLDGFGNNQECLSVYRNEWPMHNFPRLVHRTYGYHASLGLMYQHTTEYLGLKPNRDEYKLLGYESHVLEHTTRAHALMVQSAVAEEAEEHARFMLAATDKPDWNGGLIDYERLKQAKAAWWQRADRWRRMFNGLDESGTRACVAFCAQTFLELCAMRLIDKLVPIRPNQTILLAGGSFYNVKLNRRVQLETGNPVFSHPLAGDQGAAMGFVPSLNVDGLCLGERVLGRRDQVPPGVEIVDGDSWVGRAADLIDEDRIVNVVRGDMEFGPRALCNTTTFARPTKENVRLINWLNERDEAMPMAPVCTRGAALALFNHSEILEVPVSDRFMITTVGFRSPPPRSLLGVAHRDPLSDVWTARPQVVGQMGALAELLKSTVDETLINTSFNYHGEPIVFTEDDACRTHAMQCFRAKTLGIAPPVTLLVRS
jgi:carbamoyltransferase